MAYSKIWLEQQLAHGLSADFLFFWGHRPSRDGSIIKTCMSQWWPSEFTEDGIVYKTAEHYMMAAKARVFGDQQILEKVLLKSSPKDAKDLGRQIRGFDAKKWDKVKYDIVKRGNYLKFSQNELLRSFLQQTGAKVLVEASPVDHVWGIGLTEDDTLATDPAHWRGENLLGFALMEVRDVLRLSNYKAKEASI